MRRGPTVVLPAAADATDLASSPAVDARPFGESRWPALLVQSTVSPALFGLIVARAVNALT